jgi:cellulose synthase/poly-beta-1,6-N-acetylglucosamine synthase-like glycosyltransferase
VNWTLPVLISAGFLVSHVLLAPVLQLVGRASGRRKTRRPGPRPSISVVVPASNEEKSIARKIDTLWHALQRARVEAEVLIGSDGSTDRTVAIAARRLKELGAGSWRLLEFPNEGKCSTLNKLVGLARGDVIVSTDADIPVPPHAIELVVQAFQADQSLGCLSCIPWFGGLDIGSQASYWSVEQRIRRSESALGKLIVVTGMLYAYRRELFETIPGGVMADDLWVPLTVLMKGYRSIQVEQLLVPYEDTVEETEVVRRQRVMVGGMDVVRRLGPRLIRHPSVFGLVMFHKVNRWAMPFWLGLGLLAVGGQWPWAFAVYTLAMGTAWATLGSRRCRTLAYAGISPVLALTACMSGRDWSRWEHTRGLEPADGVNEGAAE